MIQNDQDYDKIYPQVITILTTFMFCWLASLYKLVNKATGCRGFRSIFIYVNLHIFRVAVDPTLGDTTVV